MLIRAVVAVIGAVIELTDSDFRPVVADKDTLVSDVVLGFIGPVLTITFSVVDVGEWNFVLTISAHENTGFIVVIVGFVRSIFTIFLFIVHRGQRNGFTTEFAGVGGHFRLGDGVVRRFVIGTWAIFGSVIDF